MRATGKIYSLSAAAATKAPTSKRRCHEREPDNRDWRDRVLIRRLYFELNKRASKNLVSPRAGER
jgi:hypothetical protein